MTQYLRSCLVSKRMANFKAITRLFRRFDQATLMRVIALRLNQSLLRALVDETAWWELGEGIELVRFD